MRTLSITELLRLTRELHDLRREGRGRLLVGVLGQVQAGQIPAGADRHRYRAVRGLPCRAGCADPFLGQFGLRLQFGDSGIELTE